MVKQNNSRAQGTIEYLVIIAVVVVIALVVVALVLNMSDSDATQIISNKNQNLIGKGGISIIDSIISSTGDGVISLQNTLGESLTLKTITPGAENDCEKLLTPGEKYNCYLTDINSACPCSAGQRVTCNFKVTFESSAGLQKVETFTIINDCTDQPITNPDSSLSISLTSPAAEYNVDYSDRNTDFTFRANRATTDCNLYIRVINEWNFARRKIQNTPRNTPITIDANVASFGTNVNSWKIQCADEENNTGESQDREITYSPSTPTTYTVTYDDNGATSGDPPTDLEAYESGATVIVLGTNTMQKEGYTFLNWKNNSIGTTYDEDDPFTITDNVTLHAQWAEEIGEFDCDEPLAGGYFCNGSGTIEDPYGITTIEMLQNIKQDLDAHYILLKDIEASETEDWNCTEGFCGGFEPIGGSTIKFTGSLDGNNYSINHLYINRPTQKGVGLFGYTDYTTSCFLEIKISNLNLADANIIGKENVGGLIGDFHCGRVENSSVTGTISTPIEGYNGSLGGLIGYAVSGVITNSFTKANLSSRYNVGGLIGTIEMYTQISNCYTDNNISGHIKVGGLVGSQRYTNLSNSYSKSNVTGYSDVGGIAGANYADGIITKTYSTGTITSSNGSVGGLVGLNHTAVSNSFSTAQVTGSVNNGGLIGYLNLTPPSSIGSVTNSYWDILKTGQNNCYSSGSTGCTSTNNEENLYYGENGIPFTELGFGEEWVTQINDYPILAWQN